MEQFKFFFKMYELANDPAWRGVFAEAKKLVDSGKFNPANGGDTAEILLSVKKILDLIKDKTATTLDDQAAKWLADFEAKFKGPQLVGGPVDDLLDAVTLDETSIEAIERAVNIAAGRLGFGGIFLSLIIEIVIAILRKRFGV